MNLIKALWLAPLLAASTATSAAVTQGTDLEIDMYEVSKEGVGQSIGSVRIVRHADGMLFQPSLDGLSPGLHGFHVHENPSCEPAEKDGEMTAAAAAGGHLNPDGEGEHNGPYDEGHLGDLPALYVDEHGLATIPVLAPRIKLDELMNRALVIHAGGDNYSEHPEPLGGGGERVACGIISPIGAS